MTTKLSSGQVVLAAASLGYDVDERLARACLSLHDACVRFLADFEAAQGRTVGPARELALAYARTSAAEVMSCELRVHDAVRASTPG